MGFRFRKSINLGNGVKLNVSKKGIGISAGVKGARISYGANGKIRTTSSIPGTGISHTSTLNKSRTKKRGGKSNNDNNNVSTKASKVNVGTKNYKSFYIFYRLCAVIMILLGTLVSLVKPVGLIYVGLGIINWFLGGFYKREIKREKENERT